MAKINFRHNIMNINSISAFLNIRGGYNNNTKDVYLVRGIGEPDNIDELIAEADKKMSLEMANNRLQYNRIHLLPQLRDINDSDYYSEAYLKWTQGAMEGLRNIRLENDFKIVVSEALAMILDKYKEAKKSVTTSMARNFAVKVLYWFDQTVAAILSGWNERSCIKIIADNVVKDQEYMFYLFLTFIGCDVFLIENQADVDAADELLKYSQRLVLGEFGKSQIKPYVKCVQEEKAKKTAKKEIPAALNGSPVHNTRVVIPERPSRKKGISASAQNTRNILSQPVQNTMIRQTAAGAEKSFEELAQLASSVVLIAVHDSRGDIIGTGSGIMIGRNGFILTNNHVASGGKFYSVRIEDEEEVYTTDEVIKYNSTTDLAVIRIKRQLNPIPIYRGEKKLARGQKVVAIGSPLGLFNSVSDGIISGFRNINNVDMIQFTAPISHGSSGGAVLNMQGEVIGISTAGFDSGQNINLAIGYENIGMFTNGFIN